ncbi:antibiotic biosynthesis monooxygenase [Geodermatophilus arenarius]|uniref:Antibiotic biosynthesis monooxygenase family protein n=1 Tax=Geodermatophilus arenarius TaxID=1137990 RepID=A0ABV9LR56_9ACTN
MVLEHALLPVRPGREEEFEAAFGRARPLVEASPGFRSLRLSRCLERPGTYLLLVEWDRLEDHTEGFRGSVGYREWKALLHSFYDPFPVVEHFTDVVATGDQAATRRRSAASIGPDRNSRNIAQ